VLGKREEYTQGAQSDFFLARLLVPQSSSRVADVWSLEKGHTLSTVETDSMSEESRVLLVDDEEDFVSVLADRLEARDLRVDTAENGEVALAKALKKTYDAILLDMAMPGMNGIETLKGLLAINPDLQVILLTGRATLEQAVEAMKLGALDFLEKPADIAELVTKIAEAATKKSSLEERRIEEKMNDILRKKGW
jgi:DNA-binding NtrC family response regulator